MRRFIISFAFLAATHLPAFAQDGGAPAGFIEALDRRDFESASRLLTEFGDQRTLKSGNAQADPLLSALNGLITLAAYRYHEAAVILERAPIAGLPSALQFRTGMARGRAFELTGQRRKALAAFRESSAVAISEPQRAAATIAIARQLLVDDPSAARTLLYGLNSAVQAREWQVAVLLAQIEGLLGRPDLQRHHADRAWALAVNAPAEETAPLAVATVQAGVAAASGDRSRERAMLAAANGLMRMPAGRVSTQLPVCGDDGIKPSDYVVLAAVESPFGRSLAPIAASRWQVVAPFFDRLTPFPAIKDRAEQELAGTVMTLRCRTIVSASYVEGPVAYNPLLSWFADHGFHFPGSSRSDDEGNEAINRLVDRVEAYERRFGKDSIMLLEPRYMLLANLITAQQSGKPVLPGQVTDLYDAIIKGLRAANAPDHLISSAELDLRTYRVTNTAFSEQSINTFVDILGKRIAAAPPNIAQIELVEAFGSDKPEIKTQAATEIIANKDRIASATQGRAREAWMYLIAGAQRELGKPEEAKRTIAALHLPRDLCSAMEEAPSLLSQEFKSSDYPHDLLAGQHQGWTMFEADVAANGRVGGARLIVSFPSLLFEPASAKGIATVVYSQPKRGGRAVACRGVTQPIVWRLSDDQAIEFTPVETPVFPDAT